MLKTLGKVFGCWCAFCLVLQLGSSPCIADGESSDVLKEAQIKIWDEEECKTAFQKEVPISEVYLCAGDGNGRQDSCQVSALLLHLRLDG